MSLKQHLAQTPYAKAWEALGVGHHHGIVLPLFALRDEKSAGIGEYLDLLPFLPWCKELGFDVIQLLPLNDTSGLSSPYSALSPFALNPLHLSLHALPNPPSYPELKALNASPRISYEKIYPLKLKLLRKYYKETAPAVLASAEYARFCQNHPWLEDYGLFCMLKTIHKGLGWKVWPKKHQQLQAKERLQLLKHHAEEIQYHQFIQYLCFTQLSHVKHEADKYGIKLMGDLPILISLDSVDTWAHRDYFDTESSAGCPPDAFAENGQYWGVPLYHWERMEEDDFSWWHRRLHAVEELYHLYRLDHILGFFRIFAIQNGSLPCFGSYRPPESSQWLIQGRKILTHLATGNSMLPVGEDLGTVPAGLKETLEELGIPGTRIQRWMRHWNEGGTFLKPKEYPPLTLNTVSTHDSATLAMWWQEHPNEAKILCEQKSWHYNSSLKQEQRISLLRDAHKSKNLFHINPLQEYLALFPELVSERLEEERINTPGTIGPHNWSYRFRPYTDALLSHEGLKSMLRAIVPLTFERAGGGP